MGEITYKYDKITSKGSTFLVLDLSPFQNHMSPAQRPPLMHKMRAAQTGLLEGMLLASACLALLRIAVAAGGWAPLPPLLWGVLVATVVLMLSLFWLIRRVPGSYTAVAVIQMVGGFVLFTYVFSLASSNELRVLWYLIGIGGAYILLGQQVGIGYTLAGIATVAVGNSYVPAPYSFQALMTFMLAMLLSSACFCIFVRHALQLYQHLAERDQQFTILTEGAEEVIWRLHPDMTVAYVSPSDERLRGFPATEVIGKRIEHTLAPEGVPILRRALEQRSRMVTLPMRGKNGQTRWFEMSSRQYFDAQGKPAGLHSIGRDVTERLKLERALETERHQLELRVQERTSALSVAKETAEEALRTKSIFLANIGHELRTPMTLIIGMTEMARVRASDARLHPLLNNVLDAAKGLMVLLNDLIDLAALEAQRISFKLAPMSMHDTAMQAVELLSPQAHAKGLALSLVSDNLAQQHLHLGDQERIQQVLVNLLDNAVKFSDKGHVRLDIQAVQDAENATTWKLQVIDQGVGIAADHQGRLFTLFEQVDGSSTRAFEGAGLGLALCKRLVEGMGGTIGVESTLNHGSCFWFTLTLNKSSASRESQPSAAMDSSSAAAR